MQQKMQVPQDHCWIHEVQTVHRHNSRLAVLQPTIPGVEVGQKSLLVLRMRRNLDLRHAAVSVLLGRDCFREGTWAVAVSGWKGRPAEIWQERQSFDWKAPLAALW